MSKYNWLKIWEYAKPFIIIISITSGSIMVASGIDRSNGLLIALGGFFLGSALQKIYIPLREFIKSYVH